MFYGSFATKSDRKTPATNFDVFRDDTSGDPTSDVCRVKRGEREKKEENHRLSFCAHVTHVLCIAG